MESLTLRRAVPADALALSSLSRDTFTETFGHCYRPDDLAAYLDAAYVPQDYATALAGDSAGWLLEDAGGHVHGYAFAGPCTLPHPDVRAGDLELKRLYVRKALQNGGWGQRLFELAMAWMQAQQPSAIWLGVWSENHGAQRFYRRAGFAHVGDYRFAVGEARDLEFIFCRRLDPAG